MSSKRLPTIFCVVIGMLLVHTKFYAQKINQFNDQKKRTGIWKKYYPNNNIRYTGQFVNGKEVGLFTFYDEKNPSVVTFTKNFSKTSDSAFVKYYSIKGKLTCEGYMVRKDRVGAWTYYFQNGKILSKEHYEAGKLHGKLENYYSNGKLLEESHYQQGVLWGSSKKYAEDGTLLEEVTFKEGVLHGPAAYYELNGTIKEKGAYNNGKRVGQWEFYIDGKKSDTKTKTALKKETLKKKTRTKQD